MRLCAIAEVLKIKGNAVDAGGVAIVQDDRHQGIGVKQAIALGLVLTPSNFGTGIGAGR